MSTCNSTLEQLLKEIKNYIENPEITPEKYEQIEDLGSADKINMAEINTINAINKCQNAYIFDLKKITKQLYSSLMDVSKVRSYDGYQTISYCWSYTSNEWNFNGYYNPNEFYDNILIKQENTDNQGHYINGILFLHLSRIQFFLKNLGHEKLQEYSKKPLQTLVLFC